MQTDLKNEKSYSIIKKNQWIGTCEHPAHQVNVFRKGVLCAPDSSKFFGTPCISAFSLSPHVQVSHALDWSFIKFIHWALSKFQYIEWNRKLVQSSVNWFLLLYSKTVTIFRGFLSTIWFTTTRLCKARGRLMSQMQLVEFSGKAWFQIFTQKWLLENFTYFVSVKLKSLKSNKLLF